MARARKKGEPTAQEMKEKLERDLADRNERVMREVAAEMNKIKERKRANRN